MKRLTLPSRGRRPASRSPPLMSNVRPQVHHQRSPSPMQLRKQPNPSMYPIRSITLALLLSVALSAFAGGKGYIGISIAVEGEGVFWNPTLKSVKVAKVSAGSPAEQAGMAAGDSIIEVEGNQVAGAKANDLQSYMQREVGQQLKFVVKKPSGEVKSIVVVAGPKPE
jgi:membrane-associated protease RseP (regulator of RpoE activity)